MMEPHQKSPYLTSANATVNKKFDKTWIWLNFAPKSSFNAFQTQWSTVIFHSFYSLSLNLRNIDDNEKFGL